MKIYITLTAVANDAFCAFTSEYFAKQPKHEK